MRGSVRRDGPGWSFVVDNGIDPATGKRRQVRRRGFRTRKEADAALASLLKAAQRGDWMQPSVHL